MRGCKSDPMVLCEGCENHQRLMRQIQKMKELNKLHKECKEVSLRLTGFGSSTERQLRAEVNSILGTIQLSVSTLDPVALQNYETVMNSKRQTNLTRKLNSMHSQENFRKFDNDLLARNKYVIKQEAKTLTSKRGEKGKFRACSYPRHQSDKLIASIYGKGGK